MPRLFFALWPDAATRARLDGARRSLPDHSGRPVPARNLHLTLVFLGDVADTALAALEAGAAMPRGAPFTLVLDRYGGFGHAGVAWLAPSRIPEELLWLVEALRDTCRAAGLAPDPRPYVAHLTVARKIRVVTPAELAPLPWPVTDFHLVESTRDTAGSEYRIRASWPLIAP